MRGSGHDAEIGTIVELRAEENGGQQQSQDGYSR